MHSTVLSLLVVLLLLAEGCSQHQEGSRPMEAKQQYSLCPMAGGDSRRHLLEVIREFAARTQARVVDRGAEAQEELAGMRTGKNVLDSSGGDLMVLTVEVPNDFRVSLSNLGLKEKVALSIRRRKEEQQDPRITALFADIERYWTIAPVEGGVTDEPRCKSDQ